MTPDDHRTASFPSAAKLVRNFADGKYRKSYVTHYLAGSIADQIRALRGARSQAQFGRLIGKPQSVVSRLEDEGYGRVSVQTLLDIAQKLDVGLIVRFVDHPTFLRMTDELAGSPIVPKDPVTIGRKAAPRKASVRKKAPRQKRKG